MKNVKSSTVSKRAGRPLIAPGRSRQAATRARILTAGLRLFARTPYEFVTMDEVAQHAGVAKGTLYLHFVSKQALYRGVVNDGFQELERNYPVDPYTDVAEGLRRWIIAVIQFCYARRDFIQVLGLHEERLQSGLIKEWRERGMVFLRSLIEAGMASGVFHRMDSLLVSFVIAGAVRSLFINTSERRQLEERGEELARMMLEWLMNHPRSGANTSII